MCGSFGRDITGEKFLDAVDRMIGDARQYVAQVAFRVAQIRCESSRNWLFGMAKSPFRKRNVWCLAVESHRRTRRGGTGKAFFRSPPSTQNVFLRKVKRNVVRGSGGASVTAKGIIRNFVRALNGPSSHA